jgi:hypothetical protein
VSLRIVCSDELQVVESCCSIGLKELQSVYQFLAVECPNLSPRAWPTSSTPSHISDILQSTSSPFPSAVKHQPESFPRACRSPKSNLRRRSSIWTISTRSPGNVLSSSSSLAVVHQHPHHSRTRLCRRPLQQSIQYGDSISGRRSRERAITLAGDEAAPPFPMAFSGPSVTSPPAEWRASTGRNDLSQRQLWLLRDMLNKSDSSPTMLANLQIPEEGTAVNRNWRWGEATSSTITLPSEESGRNSSSAKKRRYSRIGMSGLRDMLRSLTRGQQPTSPAAHTYSAHLHPRRRVRRPLMTTSLSDTVTVEGPPLSAAARAKTPRILHPPSSARVRPLAPALRLPINHPDDHQ